MTPNFEQMTKAELRAYVLAHRDDVEALRLLMNRDRNNKMWYQIPQTPAGDRQVDELLRRKISGEAK
jgi:hypothetical protein